MTTEKVTKEIQELRAKRYSCSQATLVGLARNADVAMPDEKILMAASVGLRGGIGRTFGDGTCGAVTGAVIALGLMFPDDLEKAVVLSKELFNKFSEEFGTVCCGKITDANGKKRCTECCMRAGSIAAELYQREMNKTQDNENK